MRISQVLLAILSALVGKPRAAIVAPVPGKTDGLPRLVARSAAIDLTEIGQTITGPAARCDASHTPPIDAVVVADHQLRLLRRRAHLSCHERPGMKIE